jgi:5-methylcytosine-specific restriction endonuclease McrA
MSLGGTESWATDASGTFQRLNRTCLSCRTQFDSAWAGERICQRCKGTTTWRNGAATTASRSDRSHSRAAPKGSS